MLAAAQAADLVVGSRYCRRRTHGRLALESPPRQSDMNRATRWVVGSQVRDASTAYRLYRREALEMLDLRELHATGYAYLEEILAHLLWAGARVVESRSSSPSDRPASRRRSLAEAVGKVVRPRSTGTRAGDPRWSGGRPLTGVPTANSYGRVPVVQLASGWRSAEVRIRALSFFKRWPCGRPICGLGAHRRSPDSEDFIR